MALLTFPQFLSVVEIRTKIVSVSSFLLGTLYAATVARIDPEVTLLMATAVLAVDMGTTAFNTFFDYLRRVDSRDFQREREKVLLHEGVPPGAALIVAAGLYAAAVLFGLLLTILIGIEIALVGALSMAVGYFYTGGPRPLSTTPFGELFAGGFLGSVLFVLSAYVQTDNVSPEMVFGSLPSFFLVASILTVNNTCDIEGDRAAGRKTLAILLGPRMAPILIYVEGMLAWAVAILAFAEAPLDYLFLGVPLVLCIAIYVRMHLRGYRHATKPQSMASISKVFLLYTVGAALVFCT